VLARVRSMEATRRCAGCGEIKALDAFHRSASGNAGRASRCKVCRNQETREYVARRREVERRALERGMQLSVILEKTEEPG
jgi:hypothetical protein